MHLANIQVIFEVFAVLYDPHTWSFSSPFTTCSFWHVRKSYNIFPTCFRSSSSAFRRKLYSDKRMQASSTWRNSLMAVSLSVKNKKSYKFTCICKTFHEIIFQAMVFKKIGLKFWEGKSLWNDFNLKSK